MENVHFYFDEAGEKGFLEGDFPNEAFGLVAGIALPTRNVIQMNEEIQEIFKELNCENVEKIHATEIFKDGNNKVIKEKFFSYLTQKEEWLFVYEAMYPKGYMEFNKTKPVSTLAKNPRFKRSQNKKKERLYNHLLEGIIVKLDKICNIENSSNLQMITDCIDKKLLKEAMSELEYLKQDEQKSTSSAFDILNNKVVFRTLTSKIEGYDLAIKNINTIEIEEIPSYLTLAADILANALYRHLTFKIAKEGSVRLHSHAAIEGFILNLLYDPKPYH